MFDNTERDCCNVLGKRDCVYVFVRVNSVFACLPE